MKPRDQMTAEERLLDVVRKWEDVKKIEAAGDLFNAIGLLSNKVKVEFKNTNISNTDVAKMKEIFKTLEDRADNITGMSSKMDQILQKADAAVPKITRTNQVLFASHRQNKQQPQQPQPKADLNAKPDSPAPPITTRPRRNN